MSQVKDYIYIITTPLFEQNDRYKIGSTDSVEGRKKEYRTMLPDFKVVRLYKHPNSLHIEKQILNEFKEHRIANDNGRNSEWVKMDGDILVNRLDELCEDGECLIGDGDVQDNGCCMIM